VSLAVLFPTILTIIFVAIEGAQAYEISRDLQIGAGLAARALAASGSTTTAMQQSCVLADVTVGTTVVDPSQFYKVQWNKSSNPPTVTVYVQYKSSGLKQPPAFPNPDPLHLGGAFVMKTQATYRLQS